MKEMMKLSLRLALISGVAALLLFQVDTITRGPIAEAMRLARMEAVEAVLPAFDNAPDADKVVLGEGDEAVEIYRGFRGEEPSGIALRSSTQQGYSGEIAIMVGLDPAGTVTGVRILQHAETPGLGANYADPEVLDAFYAGKDSQADWRVKKDGGDMDAVTGATVTGRALGEAIEKALTSYATSRERILSAPRGAGLPAAASGAEVTQ